MGLLYFSIVAQERADRQEITIALRLSLQRNVNATFICPFITIFEPLQVQSAHLADRFRMASICCLVNVLKCGEECRPNLEANFCFFENCELRTFPWSPS